MKQQMIQPNGAFDGSFGRAPLFDSIALALDSLIEVILRDKIIWLVD